LKKFALHLLIGTSFFWSGALVNAQSRFQQPPFDLSIHNPSSDQGQRSRTTISIPVPNQAGAALKTVVLSQLPSPDQWYWGRRTPKTYLGSYNMRASGNSGKATVSTSGKSVTIKLSPAVPPGKQVNIVLEGFNPDEGVYQWSTLLIPEGEKAVASNGPLLRLNIYYPSLLP
tara:strand:- start:116 stop:631 length:516 start_codon:yes stop_codon:yes gene_type:complete